MRLQDQVRGQIHLSDATPAVARVTTHRNIQPVRKGVEVHPRRQNAPPATGKLP